MEQTFKPSAQALRSRQAGPSPPHARTDELPATQAPRLSSTLQWELPCPNQNSNSVRTLTLMPYFMPYSMPSFWYPLQAYRWTRIPSRTQMSDQLMDDVSDQARYHSQTQARYHFSATQASSRFKDLKHQVHLKPSCSYWPSLYTSMHSFVCSLASLCCKLRCIISSKEP